MGHCCKNKELVGVGNDMEKLELEVSNDEDCQMEPHGVGNAEVLSINFVVVCSRAY